MDDKITIIEGPTPTFEDVDQGWAWGLSESPNLYNIAITRLRTANGPGLVERCHRAWNSQSNMYLHFRDRLGMEDRLPIYAARCVETDDGQMLLLWCRKVADSPENAMDLNDGEDEDDPGREE